MHLTKLAGVVGWPVSLAVLAGVLLGSSGAYSEDRPVEDLRGLRAALQNRPSARIEEDDKKVVVRDARTDRIVSEFLKNDGRWIKQPDGLYLDDKAGKFYYISTDTPWIQHETMESNVRKVAELRDYAYKICPVKITKDNLKGSGLLQARGGLDEYQGMAIEQIASAMNFQSCSFDLLFRSTKYIFVDKANNRTRWLWESTPETRVISLLENFRSGKAEAGSSSDKLPDYSPLLKDLLRKEKKLIVDPLQK